MASEDGPPIVKAERDKRSYKLIRLRNGLKALLISDPDVADARQGGEEDDDSGDDEPERDAHERDPRFPFQCSQFPPTCLGFGGEDFMSEMKIRLPYHPDEEGAPNRALAYSRFKQGKTEDSAQEQSNKNAAAAMCVGVGSVANPPEAQGLAHYLEHMLFMGNAKFPDENEYDKFMARNGGSCNAYTDEELTCYHFDVRSQSLRGALERFSQFFISPLFRVESMDRELQAIESEFAIQAGNGKSPLNQVQCHTAFPTYVFKGFSSGNKKSLQSDPAEQGIDMRAKLMQLFHDHYLAGRMKLVVLGGGSLETLQKWVVELFSEIKEGGQGRWSPADTHPGCRIWQPNRLYRVAAVKEHIVLSIRFPLPSQESAYLTKPQVYCGRLVEHEGQGSLLQLLLANCWTTGISAGCGTYGYDSNSIVCFFTVKIGLTEEGAEHVMEVIGFLFQYLKMLRSTGPVEWLFQEEKAIRKMLFEYNENANPDDYATCLSVNMHLYPEAHILYGNYAVDLWKPELVIEVLSKLTPDNMRVDLLTHDFDRTASDVQIEPWFGTPFTVEAIPEDIVKLWADPPSVDPEFHIPEPNEFIPHDFTIFTSPTDVLKNPSCVLDSAALKVWHRCNKRFKTPRINACFSITFFTAEDISHAIFAQMYVSILENRLQETIFKAKCAKLLPSITLSGCRIELKIYGFRDKLHLLAKKLAENMDFTPTQEEFENQVGHFSGVYQTANEDPIEHVRYLLNQFLSYRFWDVDQRDECLPRLTFDDFFDFADAIFCKSYIECFINGNARRKDALAIAKIFKEALVFRPLPPGEWPKISVVKLPACASLLYKVDCRCEFEKTSVVQSYFQIGQGSRMLRCLTYLCEVIICEPFFNQLRTKEQLGYTVECGSEKFQDVLGMSFTVQSEKYSPEYIEGRINAFIQTIPQILRSMKNKEFQIHKRSLIEKQGIPGSLYGETELYWEQIWNHRYQFDVDKGEVALLLKVTKKDLMDYCCSYFGARSPLKRNLCIYIVGLNAREGDVNDPVHRFSMRGRGRRVIEDIDEFKRGVELYPPLR